MIASASISGPRVDDGVEVGVGFGVGEGGSSGVGVAVGVGLGAGVGARVAVSVGVGVGVGVEAIVGVGEGAGSGDAVGVGVGDGDGVGSSAGVAVEDVLVGVDGGTAANVGTDDLAGVVIRVASTVGSVVDNSVSAAVGVASPPPAHPTNATSKTSTARLASAKI